MSGKTIWHLTMSLDGYIADRHGSVAWMRAADVPAPMGAALVPTHVVNYTTTRHAIARDWRPEQ